MADKMRGTAVQPVNMALSAKEAKENFGGMVSAPDAKNAPRYDWGLQFTLNTRSLGKLKMTDLPKVGSYVEVVSYCCVKSVRESEQVDGDKDRSVELQIESMTVKPASAKSGKAVGKGYKTKASDNDGDE